MKEKAQTLTLEQIKALAIEQGFRFEVDEDGTERAIRPDGTVAVIARRRASFTGSSNS